MSDNKVTPNKEEARTLYRFLMGRGFVKRKEIPADLFGNTDNDRRKVRAVVQHYPEHFMSNQNGYCLVIEASFDDLQAALLETQSRVVALSGRAAALSRELLQRTNKQLDLAS